METKNIESLDDLKESIVKSIMEAKSFSQLYGSLEFAKFFGWKIFEKIKNGDE